MADLNTHHLLCEFGVHKGKAWTRVPVSYLLWLTNQPNWRGSDEALAIAKAELKRRGSTLPSMEISGHAIDRASQLMIGKWMETRTHDEGLHSWIVRMATAARVDGKHKGDKFIYAGIKFCFEEGSEWPILKTVMPAGSGK